MSFELGDPVPAFTLADTEGTAHSVPTEPAPAATVLIVTCNHCPYVVAWNPRLRAVAEDYDARGVRFLAINANDAARYPADSPEAMARFVRDGSWPIPYLLPFSNAWQWSWRGQWPLNAWQNFAITLALLLAAFFLAWKNGFSPLEMISPRADRALVTALRTRFPRTEEKLG